MKVRDYFYFPCKNKELFFQQLLKYSEKYENVCFINGNEQQTKILQIPYGSFPKIFAIGAKQQLAYLETTPFCELQNFLTTNNDWAFGFFAYDLKNDIEKLSSENFDGLFFPKLFFFQPELIFIEENEFVKVGFFSENYNKLQIEDICLKVSDIDLNFAEITFQQLSFQNRFTKEEYLATVEKIKHHIQIGDIYEMNFCMEFFAENAVLDSLTAYILLNKISPTSFSAFYKMGDKFIISASPERYLKKNDNILVSQPIKGTARRGQNETEDCFIKEELQNNLKERAENVMIVDLVRNDFSRVAQRGSVKVAELCKIYSFPQVHQLISTVVCNIKQSVDIVETIEKTFPMGSMTGAPKVMAMKLIEKYERTKRGVFSGAVGFFTPEGNFDFNVVIRSMLYNKTTKYLSFSVGSAITSKSNAEDEYEECLLKASAIIKTLNINKLQ